ncbi:universal stress protein [Aquimarina sp. U1-2]|uniref:universal stress protein n=1 Tax=Aquimarina sp. U1-2 TaxID=2823141 RepID=UPI001AECA45A|nr:universal stress protein [Aquimarina sp. U1-2]MBP2831931.1 universal stress protein [Aquimarina sp. U1-2]
MKHILIPIDFSENALKAIDYAKILFENESCTFFLLNVYITNPSFLMGDEYNDEWIEEMSKDTFSKLHDLIHQIKTSNQNELHVYQSVSESDTLEDAVVSVVTSKHIDIIVMGTKGAKSAKEIFLGSNTVKVINHVNNCPILVIPKNYVIKSPETIVFSTNFKRNFYEKEMSFLIEIASSHQCKINIARVMLEEYLSENQKTNKEKLKSLLSGLDHVFFKIDIEDDETDALRDFIVTSNADMICLINHRYNFFQQLMQENVVKKISFDSPSPVLILPEIET